MHHPASPAAEPAAGVIDRPDTPRGFWGIAWPIIALGLMLLMVLRACVPEPPAAPVQTFDPYAAAAKAIAAGDQALAALPANAPLEAVLKAANMGAVYFEDGSIEIGPDAQAWLARVAKALAALPAGTRIEVQSHTDGSGDAELDMTLTTQRAEAVRDLLIAQGVPADRLVAKAFGDTKPVASNDTREGRFRNRRIEFAPLR